MAGSIKQILLACVVCLTACSTTQTTNPATVEAPILVDTNWKEPSPSKVTLSFRFASRDKYSLPSFTEHDSREGLYFMGGMGGCNGANVGYIQNGWSLKSTGAGPSTLLDCNNQRVAEDYRLANALAKVRTFTITETNRLILFDENKQKLLVLDRNTNKTP